MKNIREFLNKHPVFALIWLTVAYAFILPDRFIFFLSGMLWGYALMSLAELLSAWERSKRLDKEWERQIIDRCRDDIFKPRATYFIDLDRRN